MNSLDQDLGGRRGWGGVGMLQSGSPSFRPRVLYLFTSISPQLFLFSTRYGRNRSAGELTHLQDANWEGALVSSVASSPANCCVVLRHLELQMCFLLCVRESCGLCPGCVAADMTEKKLALLIYIKTPTDSHCCEICFHQVSLRNVIFWDFLSSELESYPPLVLVM